MDVRKYECVDCGSHNIIRRRCEIPDCDMVVLAKRLCSKHYNRVRRGGGVEGLGQGCRTDLAGPPVVFEDDGFWEQVHSRS